MIVIVQGPDGSTEMLTLNSAADIQARPGFVYTFLDVDPAQAQFQVDAEGGKHLIVDLPGQDGPIRLLDFMDVLAGDQPAKLQWLQGADTVELQADSLNDFLTGAYTFRPAVEGLGDDRAGGDPLDSNYSNYGSTFAPAKTVPGDNGAAGDPGDSLGGSLLSTAQAAAVTQSFGMFLKAHGPVIEGGSTPANEPSILTYPKGNTPSADTEPLAVKPVDDARWCIADGYALNEDQVLSVDAAAGVLANDRDPSGISHPVTAFDAVSARGGTVAMNPDGSFTYTPAANFNGADSFTYSVTDSHGRVDSAIVSLTVNAVNDAPTTNAVSATGAEDAASISITLTGGDIDGTVASFALASLPANGTLYTDAGLTSAAATGTDYAASGNALTIYFVPAANFNGATSLSYAA